MVSLQSVSRRQHHRFERPEMGVRLNGLSGSTRDWSLGGIAVRLPDDGLSGLGEADEVSGELEIGPSGERHDFKGKVVRVERVEQGVFGTDHLEGDRRVEEPDGRADARVVRDEDPVDAGAGNRWPALRGRRPQPAERERPVEPVTVSGWPGLYKRTVGLR